VLRIRRVKRYRIARYPRGRYSDYTPPLPESLFKRGAISLFALTVLETLSCDSGNGVTGPPPLPPKLVTENEARPIIEQVFADNGVQLERDLPLILHLAADDSVTLDVDGFNPSLRVGYEYVFEQDSKTFTPRVVEVLDSLVNESGPYIKPVDSIYKEGDYSAALRATVQEFIDTLKAHGVI
jgi:hypothetical protein